MTVLVFILINLALYSDVSTSANQDLSFGWLQLHRHGLAWFIKRFDFGRLVLNIFISVILTGMLSKLLGRQRANI